MQFLKLLLCCTAAFVLGLMSGNGASADIIGVDVRGTAYTGPGVLDTSSRQWTLATTSGATFLLDGQPITLTFSGFSGDGAIGSPGIDLFREYKFTNHPAVASVVLAGLDPNLPHNLVLYGAQDSFGGRGTTFTLGGQPKQADAAGADFSVFTEGVNYVRFDEVFANASGEIQFSISTGPQGSHGFWNGFELQVVPEPSTLLLLLAAVAAALCVRGGRR